jgi:hypothetical protein
MWDDLGFAQHLAAKDMELYEGRGRLRVWPKHSYANLPDPERAYLDSHREGLLALVRACLQPKVPDVGTPVEPPCPFCCRPCVGPEHGWFPVLHWREAAEVERRCEERQRRDAFDRATWELHEVP